MAVLAPSEKFATQHHRCQPRSGGKLLMHRPRLCDCELARWPPRRPLPGQDAELRAIPHRANAGIDRGSKKEEEAKRRAAIQKALDAGEEIPPELLKQEGGGPAASEADSRDTVERMADQLQELEDKNQELEKRLEDMENQSKSLVDERDKLQEDLDDATDKIEYMEEAEERWRDKVAKARIENDRIFQDLERASFVSSDREGGLIASLLDARQLREVIAVMKRRRAFMLANMQEELRKRQEDDERKTVLNSWKIRIMKDAFQKELDDLDVRRRKEVRELQEQLLTDRTHITALQVHVEQLRGKLRQAAHRMVERSMSSKVWPFAQSHALRAWCGIHPSVVLENELERTRKKLQDRQRMLWMKPTNAWKRSKWSWSRPPRRGTPCSRGDRGRARGDGIHQGGSRTGRRLHCQKEGCGESS
ncbi:unnamed protein product [Effrenium voratum]|nr:unnamed protein product [Effrenium voratum]